MVSCARLLSFVALASAVACGSSDSSAPPPPTDPGGAPPAGASTDAPPVTPDAPTAPPPAASMPDLGPAGDFTAYATKAAAALDGFYDGGSGLFATTGWWNSANGITALADFMLATKTTAYEAHVMSTFTKNETGQYPSFLNKFYDDEGWWALAWIRAYDLTSNADYLKMAKTIFADMAGGWDTTCNGGIWWNKDRMYKNAIANELFLKVAASLHNRTPGDAGPGSFLEWATKEWTWFLASGMINGKNLINDGLASCKNNNGQTWTYNQGVVLGGLVELAKATGDKSVLTTARAIANATMDKLVDELGVLHEPCEPSCGGDGSQFKGIFMRNLGELTAAAPDPKDRPFLAKSADYAWNTSRNGSDQIGLVWSGPFDSADAARQTSALDALVAAIPYSEAAPNLALNKTASGNGTCASGEEAGKAVDGMTSTKWCSGATAGAYWLEIDFGKAEAIGRLIVRHAGAGGETDAWDTKDFTLSSSTDGKTWTPAAKTTNNTRSVTIHSFAPVSATKLRLDIQSPQSTTTTVAARIDELEAYAR
ncbi:MAG TPA: glycoside hydrolase family 76 protein [Labilithrix sp.]